MTRRESDHAAARKAVDVATLLHVKLLAADDALVFSYNGRDFAARVAASGCIVAPVHAAHTRANSTRDGESWYKLPSHFTNDCVAAYWADVGTPGACRTNPSGYERVVHVRTQRTLNSLRDECMQRFCTSTVGAKRRRIAQHVDPDIVSVLADPAVTIATIRAHHKHAGYKDIAEMLETKLALHREALVRLASGDRDVLVARLEAALPPLPVSQSDEEPAVVASSMPVDLGAMLLCALSATNARHA